jgi:penicillin-binding protein 1B
MEDVLNEYPPNSRPILDSRVAYLTLALMENVINSGTGGTVRAHGFTAPAAGKTGTSRDAWFAGFTSNLLCVVWIGNDDYSDLKLEGGKTAAIVWTEFMKQAVRLPQYSDTKDFLPPTGVVQVKLDKATNLLADASCPDSYTASFLDGRQPKDTCDHSIGDQQNLFQQIFGTGKKPINPVLVPNTSMTPPQTQATSSAQQPAVTAGAQNPPSQPDAASKKKRGFFRRLFGGDKKDEQQQQSQQQPQ